MLVDNSNKIIIIKLISGEEIVCNKIKENDNGYEVVYPLSFVMAYNPEYPTQGEVSFSPWLVGSTLSDTHTISKNSIIAIVNPSSVVEEKYKTALGITGASQAPSQNSVKSISNNRGARR